jgi:hypothetical protein
LGIFFKLEVSYPILWDGHLARPCIISGQDARTTKNLGIFFKLEVSYPILWDGHLARPCIISGQDARTTKNFVFLYKSPKIATKLFLTTKKNVLK